MGRGRRARPCVPQLLQAAHQASNRNALRLDVPARAGKTPRIRMAPVRCAADAACQPVHALQVRPMRRAPAKPVARGADRGAARRGRRGRRAAGRGRAGRNAARRAHQPQPHIGGGAAGADPRIDCVLLDLGLPDTAGWTPSRGCARDAGGAADRADRTAPTRRAGMAAVDAGAQDYLVKGDVDGEQLARSIHYAIGRRRAEDAERELLLAEAAGARGRAARTRSRAQALCSSDPTPVVASATAPAAAARCSAATSSTRADRGRTLHALWATSAGTGPRAAIGVVPARRLAGAGTRRTSRRRCRAPRCSACSSTSATSTRLFTTLCALEIDPASRRAKISRRASAPDLIDGALSRRCRDGASGAAIGLRRRTWSSER